MNLCLTSKCNNHCPYCFQEDFRKKEDYWDIQELEKVIKWINGRNQISVLGGEPTLYPHLESFINLLNQETETLKQVLFITNLLGPDESIEQICSCNVEEVALLINATYDNDKEDIFEKHLLHVAKYKNIPKSLSITLFPNKDFNTKYIERLIKYSNPKYDIQSFRIGLMTPKPDEKIFNIYNYDEEIQLLIDLYKENNLNLLKGIHFDCAINFCQISLAKFNEIKKIPFIHGLSTICNGSPLDIWPNHNIIYCSSSTGDFIKYKYEDFENGYEAELFLDKLKFQYITKNKKCLNCEYFKLNICHPCHSFDQALLRGEGIDT